MSSDRSNSLPESSGLADSGAGSAESGDDSADPDGTSDQRGAAPAAARAWARRDLQIQNPCGYPEVAARRLRPWLEEVLAELAPDAASATVRFVSDREMHQLNHRYRGYDKPTDVLTFAGDLPARAEAERSKTSGEPTPDVPAMPAMPDVPGHGLHLGDVVVSVPTARRQAGSRGHGPERELRLLTLHGILHCLGYDHETDDGTMERVEDELRSRFLAEAA